MYFAWTVRLLVCMVTYVHVFKNSSHKQIWNWELLLLHFDSNNCNNIHTIHKVHDVALQEDDCTFTKSRILNTFLRDLVRCAQLDLIWHTRYGRNNRSNYRFVLCGTALKGELQENVINATEQYISLSGRAQVLESLHWALLRLYGFM